MTNFAEQPTYGQGERARREGRGCRDGAVAAGRGATWSMPEEECGVGLKIAVAAAIPLTTCPPPPRAVCEQGVSR
jgi:hypothetical protein